MGHQNLALIIELVSVLLGLVYLVLIMLENIWCWIFGIFSSILSVYLFIDIHLYSEAILYTFYAGVGVYGWITWGNKPAADKTLKIKKWKPLNHLITIPLGVLVSFGLGWIMANFTDSEMSYQDAHSTIFSFIASFLEAHKVLSTWFYWIAINGFSIWLYSTKGLSIYTWLMVLYFVMSFAGFYMWNKKFKAQAV